MPNYYKVNGKFVETNEPYQHKFHDDIFVSYNEPNLDIWVPAEQNTNLFNEFSIMSVFIMYTRNENTCRFTILNQVTPKWGGKDVSNILDMLERLNWEAS